MGKLIAKFKTVAVNPLVDSEGGYSLRLTDRPIYDESQVFEEVVKEKTLPFDKDMLEFAFLSVIKTMAQKVSRDCNPRKIGSYIKFTPYLRGKVKGPFSQFDPATCTSSIGVRLLAGLDRQVDRDRITFVNDQTGEQVKVERISWIGSDETNVVKVGQPFAAYGKNLVFKPALGDTAQILWTDAQEQEHSVDLTVTVSDYDHIAFAWPEALADLDAGVELRVKIVSRAGIEGNDEQTNEKTVTVVA